MISKLRSSEADSLGLVCIVQDIRFTCRSQHYNAFRHHTYGEPKAVELECSQQLVSMNLILRFLRIPMSAPTGRLTCIAARQPHAKSNPTHQVSREDA
jgi:hypothetical protein